MEIRRWKAFLRLTGETLVERDDEIMNEFRGFVQALKRVGIDYSIVVNVEQGLSRQTGKIPRDQHIQLIKRIVPGESDTKDG